MCQLIANAEKQPHFPDIHEPLRWIPIQHCILVWFYLYDELCIARDGIHAMNELICNNAFGKQFVYFPMRDAVWSFEFRNH